MTDINMKRDFCVFILSHGRANNVITFKTLKSYNYTGNVRIICDDEDKSLPEYRDRFGCLVYVFNKETYIKRTDAGDNFGKRGSVIFARNACWDICRDLGYKYFLVLDDDYTSFAYKWIDRQTLREKSCHKLDDMFGMLLQYYVDSGVTCIAMIQGGDLIGGDVEAFGRFPGKRKIMNSFFCALDRPFQYSGIMNDDVNTYLLLGNYGHVCFSVREALLHQAPTQKSAGGLTELYLDAGTYVKSFYSVMFAPSCTKIATVGAIHHRIHHKVDWQMACPKIIGQEWKK